MVDLAESIYLYALCFSSLLSLLGIALTMRHKASMIPDFSIVLYVGLGVIVTFSTVSQFGLNLYLSPLLSFAVGCILGGLHYWAVMRVMERRGDGEVPRVLSTIGLQIMASALLGIGADRIYAITGVNSIFLIIRPYDVVLWDIPGIYYVILLVCVAIYFTLFLLFRKTTLGFRLVASGENPELAMIQGTDPWRLKLLVWSLSGGVACLAGSLFPQFSHIFPGGEVSWIAPVMAVGVLCGFDSLVVAVLAAFAVGLFETLGILWLQGIWGVWVGEYTGMIPVAVIYFSMFLIPRGLGTLWNVIQAKTGNRAHL